MRAALGWRCVMLLATDAPVDARNLRRMAARTLLGMARTGSFGSNGSGDYGMRSRRRALPRGC